MNKTIYYLASCSTCKRIMKELGVDNSWNQREIKSQSITEKEIDLMKNMAGSYNSLFSRRSMKYRAWKLNEQVLSEKDYKDYILKEYTFLKRPVIIINEKIFIGNSKKVINDALQALSG